MDRSVLIRILALAPALLLAPTPGAGQCEPELVETFMSDDPGDRFGRAVAIDGDVIVVGAQSDDDAAPAAGAIYVYRAAGDGWTLEQKITASDAKIYNTLGSSVAVLGDLIVAGAPGFDKGRGAVYVFRRDAGTWKQEAKLIPPGQAEEADFGRSVAVEVVGPSTVIVGGAPAWWPNVEGIGAVHVYRGTAGVWESEGKLAPADGKPHRDFGASVAMEGNQLLVGSPWSPSAVYVFSNSGENWIEESILFPHDPYQWQYFGIDVAVDGDTALIGAYAYDNGCDCPLPGAAYVFRLKDGDWLQEAKLIPSDGLSDEFGHRVGLDEGLALVGSSLDSSAYLYQRTPKGWKEQAKLDQPGLWVADLEVSSGRAVLGGPIEGTGPVFLYRLCETNCYADLDGSGDLTFFDFLAYVNLFNAGDAAADCDESATLDLFDFLCFLNAFNEGCE